MSTMPLEMFKRMFLRRVHTAHLGAQSQRDPDKQRGLLYIPTIYA